MSYRTPHSKLGLKLWSDDTPLRAVAGKAGLTAKYIHIKGDPVTLANGSMRASKATRHYLATENTEVNSPDEFGQGVADLLQALRGTELASLILSGAVEAEIDLVVFRGDIDWESLIEPSLVAGARAANIRLLVEHYDRFTDEGAPLAVRL